MPVAVGSRRQDFTSFAPASFKACRTSKPVTLSSSEDPAALGCTAPM
eukprot:CAMPEP_0175114472 /NCGR_PEP_ID=MMETSP0086_2-20121207/16893_1 /TAXON_ID=136419 /ORGANISM="Unknown Unknown, Strain D1" /LENGTH=46 /DNA_ID= /DNA_START= /DNA_END= /DNA_ORIENTATION=